MSIANPSTLTAPRDVLPPFNLYTMIAPVVVGGLFNAGLFGGLVVQTYVYYTHFPNDHRAMKLTVSEPSMWNTNC